ncbi:MAG: FABP family protein [Candidatus Nanopelagicales bacterium]
MAQSTGAPGPDLPAELAHLSWLIGRWGGIGEGGYPSISPFRYEQVVEFATDGRPFLEYRSVSWLVDEANNRIRRSATESGYWRPRPDNGVELLLAHPTGFAEVWIGQVEVTAIHDARVTGARIELTTDSVARTESAKEVAAGHRLYGLIDGRLLSTYDMAAVGHPLSNHLAIALEPIGPGPDLEP